MHTPWSCHARTRSRTAAITAGVIAVALPLLGSCAATEAGTESASSDTTAIAPPPTTVAAPSESSTTSTVFDNPFSDAEIADRVLLDPDEYGTDWQLFQFKNVSLDRAIAATIPGCAAYLDTVFESPDRPAVTNHRWFHAPQGRAGAMSQYVVVFPTEDAAVAMLEATNDSNFQGDCFQPYRQFVFPADDYCCDPGDDFPAPLWNGTLVSTDTKFGADDLVIRRDDTQRWNDAAGVAHGPETVDSATIRVGRTIAVLEAIRVDEFGQPFVTDEQFHLAIASISERALHALGGVNH